MHNSKDTAMEVSVSREKLLKLLKDEDTLYNEVSEALEKYFDGTNVDYDIHEHEFDIKSMDGDGIVFLAWNETAEPNDDNDETFDDDYEVPF
jgi:hypothetical protein